MNAQQYSATVVRQLGDALAKVISDFSANEVPSLCDRLGLRSGDREEAFKSKLKYAERRIIEKAPIDLISIAKRLLEEVDSYDLSEALAKIQEAGQNTVTELTRRRIMAIFEKRAFSTELDDLDFIRRVWPTSRMPSVFSNASSEASLDDDLFNAIVRNSDWSNKEVLEALGYLNCSQKQLFRFLEELTNPLVQSPNTQGTLAAAINAHLRHDGFRLVTVKRLSGSPVYEIQPVTVGSPADNEISQTLANLDQDTVHSRWAQALDRRDTDPAGAITLARTLLEDVCKWIITEAGEAFEEKDDLPVLYRKLAKILNLAPDAHTEPVFKQILGSCQSVVESLGSLRNKIGDAHSPGPKRIKPAARHAQLAVNLSGTMATFLVSTWEIRKHEMKN
ncbi:MAG: abortive infection family protein [Methylobacterium sp.]|nr:abortive infection family protein [Cupriavidus sp.]MCA3671899.1 abortive infection family protein [Methylobacterium sp.]MCA3676867.1 abortive infection family protein [Methylobacterium sp.]MCA3681303.1 abortive infection family protein [Methylobacterium sp.]MCA3682593.1 abortive infection family protein [Methylobacterium sp.]